MHVDAFNQYNSIFSKVYDSYWTEFVDIIAPQLIEFYDKQPVSEFSRHVLDLCCGTGRLSKMLLEHGFEVTGIDLSASMISIAKQKNREYIEDGRANFYVDDATKFNIESKFGLVVSTFDSLNHLKDIASLQSCFQRSFKALIDGGWFIFDLNTEKGLKSWNFIDLEDLENDNIIMHGVYNRGERRAYTKVYGFHKTSKNCYEKFEEIMYNTVFSLEEVKQLLLDVGFSFVMFTKEDDLKAVVEDPENESRVVVMALKSVGIAS